MGYFRFISALAVAIYHLWGFNGGTTVFCFYTVAGYVTIYLRSEVYPPEAKSHLRFLAARFLRIWPAYLACLIIALIALSSVTYEFNRAMNRAMFLPYTFNGWWRQFLIFGLVELPRGLFYVRVLPTAWSLTIILTFYIIITLFVGTSYRRACAFLAIAFACIPAGRMLELDYTQLFLSIPGSAFPFAVGAVSYHLGKRIPPFVLPPWFAPVCIAVLCVLFFLPDLLSFPFTELFGIYRYCMALIVAPFIVLMHRHECLHPPSALNRLAGEISYPVFLLHLPLASPIAYHWLGSNEKSGLLFAAAFIASTACSVAIVFLVERPLKGLRRRI